MMVCSEFKMCGAHKAFMAGCVKSTAQKTQASVLRQDLFAEVGEAFELILVDLFNNGVLHWREHRLLAGKVLVKIIDVPFGFLWMKNMPHERICVFG